MRRLRMPRFDPFGVTSRHGGARWSGAVCGHTAFVLLFLEEEEDERRGCGVAGADD